MNHFENGRRKAEQKIENITKPDGLYDPSEDKEMKDLLQKAARVKADYNRQVEDLFREADKIGGPFRGPGYKYQVKQALK